MANDRSGSEREEDDSGRIQRSVYLLPKREPEHHHHHHHHSNLRSVYLMPDVERSQPRPMRRGTKTNAKTHDEECVREKRHHHSKKRSTSNRSRHVKKESSTSSQDLSRERASNENQRGHQKKSGSSEEHFPSEKKRSSGKRKGGVRKKKSKEKVHERRRTKKKDNSDEFPDEEEKADDDRELTGRKDGLSAENLRRAIELVNRHHEAERKKVMERIQQRPQAGHSLSKEKDEGSDSERSPRRPRKNKDR
ncbi:hypothetical protein Aduo_000575 [Ancylostoma duodenale]